MESKKTIVIRNPIFGDEEREHRHAALIVMKGEEIGRDFRLRRAPMIVGRGADADIRLPDDGASREHARIDYRGPGTSDDTTFILNDLGSTNHTFVNGEKIDSVRLRDGDKIQIGDTILKYIVLDSIEASFHAEVRDRISYDQLTGLLTKESLYLAFERQLDRCLRYGLPLSVLMMDLDRFKAVNDNHGHLMGSHVLSQVGRIIAASVRDVDVSARYGGEEFVSYLAETDAEGAATAAERIRRGVGTHPFTLDGVTIQVTISIGLATAPAHGTTIDELVAAADKALYQAKETGRNRVCRA